MIAAPQRYLRDSALGPSTGPFVLASDFSLPYNSDDDAFPAWEAMLKKVPDGHTIAFDQPGYLTVKEEDGLVIPARCGLTLMTGRLPFPDGKDGATVLISGRSSSGPGGCLVSLESSSNCQVSGFALKMDLGSRVDVAIRGDLTGLVGPAGGQVTGTHNRLKHLLITTEVHDNPNMIGIQIVKVSAGVGNNEFYELEDIVISGGGGTYSVFNGIHMDAGSNVIRSGNQLRRIDDGRRIRVPNAGPVTAAGQRTALDTIFHYQSDSVGYTDTPAAQTVDNERAIFRESFGIGIQQGPSADVKHTLTKRVQPANLAVGFQLLGGGLDSECDRPSDCEIGWDIKASSEPVSLLRLNSESCRQLVRATNCAQLSIGSPGRVGIQRTLPNGAYLRFLPGVGSVEVAKLHVDDPVPAGSTLYDMTGANLRFRSIGNTFHGVETMASVGYRTFAGGMVRSEGDGQIGDAPGVNFTLVKGTRAGVAAEYVELAHGGEDKGVPAVAHHAKVIACGGHPVLIAHHSQAEKQQTPPTGGGATLVGHRVSLGVDSPDANGMTFVQESVKRGKAAP